MNLEAYLRPQIGRSVIIKLLTGYDKDRRTSTVTGGEVSLILEYTPLTVDKKETVLQVRTQLAIRNTPLLRAHPYREDIGSVTISCEAASLEGWYISLAERVMDRLAEIEYSSTMNGVAEWLLPVFDSSQLRLALN